MKQCCVGIDIGGTTVKCGLFTLEGELLDKWEVPTRKEDSGQHILPDVAKKLKEKLADHGLTADELKAVSYTHLKPNERAGAIPAPPFKQIKSEEDGYE